VNTNYWNNLHKDLFIAHNGLNMVRAALY